jgi:hypothetical protein
VTEGSHQLLRHTQLDLEEVARLVARPPRFAPHEAPFWDDPYVARQMLAAHLDRTMDAASRRPDTIEVAVMGVSGSSLAYRADLLRFFGVLPDDSRDRLLRRTGGR